MTTARLVSQLLDISETLLGAGAEVSRVEDTMRRLAKAYGFKRADVFSITSSIIMTVQTGDGEEITQTRRVRRYAIDMETVERANALSRRLCEERPDPEALPALIAPLRETKHYDERIVALAYIVGAAAFTAFFGGGALEALSAGLTGLAIRWLIRLGDKLKINPLIATFLCALAGSALILLLRAVGIGSAVDTVMMGCVMLLIPGLAFTSSLRDMISGDTVTGLMGFCDALIKSVILAVGFNLLLTFGVGV